jgi:hypothetical protein
VSAVGSCKRSTATPSGWDLDRIELEIEALLEHDPAQAERFFLNRKLASEGAAFDFEAWKTLAEPKVIPDGATIVIGVDGARHDDALAIVACEVETGYIWPLDIIERPDDADENYEHDKDRADGAVSDAFERYAVWRCYCDEHHIRHLIEGWQNRYGEKRVATWLTNRNQAIAWAVRNFEKALASGDFKHSGDETLSRHVANARRRPLTVIDDKEKPMHTLGKDSWRSPRKIDGAMAAILAWEARSDAIAAGAIFTGESPGLPSTPKPERYVPGSAMNLERVAVPIGDGSPMGSVS